MKKGLLLSLIAVALMYTFVFANVTPLPAKGQPAPVQAKASVKPPVKKPLVKKIIKIKHVKKTKVSTMEPTGKKK